MVESKLFSVEERYPAAAAAAAGPHDESDDESVDVDVGLDS